MRGFGSFLLFGLEGDITQRILHLSVHALKCVCACVAHMLTIMPQFPQGNQCVGQKVHLNLRYISPQSVGMVVIQAMVNMLARTNQRIFHLLMLHFIHHSGTVLYTLRSRGAVLGLYSMYSFKKEREKRSLKVHKCVYSYK